MEDHSVATVAPGTDDANGHDRYLPADALSVHQRPEISAQPPSVLESRKIRILKNEAAHKASKVSAPCQAPERHRRAPPPSEAR